MEDDYKGLGSILGINPPKKTTKVVTLKTPEDPLMEYIDKVIYMKPLELPKNVLKKDEYGYTPAQNREINNYLTRRKPPKLANVPILNQEIKPKVNGSFKDLVKGNINDRPIIREENAVQRIERIKYEFGESKVRPKHLDNKHIVSFEDKQKVVRKNDSKLNQLKRRQ